MQCPRKNDGQQVRLIVPSFALALGVKRDGEHNINRHLPFWPDVNHHLGQRLCQGKGTVVFKVVDQFGDWVGKQDRCTNMVKG